jgi:hypothetical protein
VHAGNYSDLPLFDMLLGTWYNPRDFAPEQGFHRGASSRYASLLLGSDVAVHGEAGVDGRAAQTFAEPS